MKLLQKIPLPFILLICATLGLAPFSPLPHVAEKLMMLMNGELSRLVDVFDLFMHGTPWALLILKLYSMRRVVS